MPPSFASRKCKAFVFSASGWWGRPHAIQLDRQDNRKQVLAWKYTRHYTIVGKFITKNLQHLAIPAILDFLCDFWFVFFLHCLFLCRKLSLCWQLRILYFLAKCAWCTLAPRSPLLFCYLFHPFSLVSNVFLNLFLFVCFWTHLFHVCTLFVSLLYASVSLLCAFVRFCISYALVGPSLVCAWHLDTLHTLHAFRIYTHHDQLTRKLVYTMHPGHSEKPGTPLRSMRT